MSRDVKDHSKREVGKEADHGGAYQYEQNIEKSSADILSQESKTKAEKYMNCKEEEENHMQIDSVQQIGCTAGYEGEMASHTKPRHEYQERYWYK